MAVTGASPDVPARSWMKHRLWADDAAGLALAALGVVLLALTDDDRAANPRDLDALALGLLASAFFLLALRRRAPGWVALAVLGLNAEWHALGYTNPLIHVPTLVAFYALGTTGKRRQQLCFGAAAVLLLIVGIVGIGEAAWSDALDAVGWTVAAILFGEVVRGRRAELTTLAERAERAEAEQEAEAHRRVAAERLRLARELHDVLAHTVSVITVQAAVAADRMQRSPEAARAALDVVRAAGREAMDEVRANVVLLRESGSDLDPPAPGLARLDELVGTVAASSLDVDIIVEGVRRPLPALVELTGYRVTQEALTNVVRHAHASHCRLRPAYEPGALIVEVTDDGVGTGRAGTSRPVAGGFGLRGMAERVESDRRHARHRPEGRRGLRSACGAACSPFLGVIRIALADDQSLVRAGFRSLLADTEDVTVVGEASDGAEAVELARRARPDVLLMDIRMPGVDGLEATRRIAADPELRGVRVVVLTTYRLDEYVFEALRVGASGFLTKDVDPEELRRAVRVVADGQALLSPSVTRRLLDAFAAATPRLVEPERLDRLSERERSVLALVGAGLSNGEIAERLIMSPLTAKTHVSRTMTKLGARDCAQLVVVAYETGLVRPGA